MKSPFPGMDPYIEACGFWSDFHDDLIGEIKNALSVVLPKKYRVRRGDREVIELVEPEGKRERTMYPDVGVMGPLTRPAVSTQTGVATLDAKLAMGPIAL